VSAYFLEDAGARARTQFSFRAGHDAVAGGDDQITFDYCLDDSWVVQTVEF